MSSGQEWFADLAALARELVATDERYGWRSPQATAAYNALRDAVLSEQAAEADRDLSDIATKMQDLQTRIDAALNLQAENAALRAQIEAAAPLFEAAHASAYGDGTDEEMLALDDAADAWARSEAGQRWKKDRG